MNRRLLVAGNWKMHGSHVMTAELISGVAEQALANANTEGDLTYDILVCPPAPYLSAAVSEVQSADEQNPIKIGAQNVNAQSEGAFTGEISLAMLADLGCDYTLIGHSERRELFGETDANTAEKFAACLATEIVPVLCIGETLEERQAGNTETVVARQLDAVLNQVGIAGFNNAVVAYEPVWAIGTGETASPEQAQEVHAFIRSKFAALDKDIAERLQILYGGSVKPGNAESLFAQADIDGGLVGGASLSVENFAGICVAAQTLSS